MCFKGIKMAAGTHTLSNRQDLYLKISRNLTTDEVSSLRTYIGGSKLLDEGVLEHATAHEMFNKLEQAGVLKEGDLSFLRKLMTNIDREDYANEAHEMGERERKALNEKRAIAIVQKTNPGVDFTPDPRGGMKEEERLQKLKDWEAPLKKRVENFSSTINYSIDYEGFSAINDCMKAVCLIEHPDGYGSGFLIGPKYVITANHVWEAAYTSFSQVSDPLRFLVHFHISGTRRLTFIFKPNIFVARDGNLDYAIFEIHPASPTDHSVVSETMQSEGICPLGTKIVTNEAGDGNEDIVVIVGHPGGGRKRVDFCSMVAVDTVTSQAIAVLGQPDNPLAQWPQERPDSGSYHTSVMFEGSSGSPCFTKYGNVVFMHTHGFRPYIGRPSIVEMGVLLSRVKTDAQGKLSSEVFTEIFGS